MFGQRRLDCAAGQALVVSVEMPGAGGVSPRRPYRGVSVELDLPALREVMAGLEPDPGPGPGASRRPGGDGSAAAGAGIFVIDLSRPLLDCVLRLVRLLDTPAAIATLRPLITRELCYWLLAGARGDEGAGIGLASSHAEGIIGAVHTPRNRYAEPLRIDDMARAARMSPSAFHRQFKALPLMTPLRYQKQLRPLEARRLMVANAVTAEAAAFRVGCESASQFSREYARMFGAPPRRDVVGLRPLAA